MFQSVTGVVKVDFPGFSRNSTNFNWLYLRAPEELDNEKAHFRTFHEQTFPTPCWKLKTDVSSKSYSRLKTVTKSGNFEIFLRQILQNPKFSVKLYSQDIQRDQNFRIFKNFALILSRTLLRISQRNIEHIILTTFAPRQNFDFS